MDKEILDYLTDYVVEFEPPDNWEQLRDQEGIVMEGCYRVIPAKMSDEIQ